MRATLALATACLCLGSITSTGEAYASVPAGTGDNTSNPLSTSGDRAFASGSLSSSGAGSKSGDQGPSGLQEVVVTAQRREQRLIDTPESVSVVTGLTLQETNVSSLQDLTRIDPALTVNNSGVAGNEFIIRGVHSGIGSTVGIYIDDVPLVGVTGGQSVPDNGDGKPGLRMHDVDRLEVLQGPQGTLFGAGSMAGTVRIVNNKPKLDVAEGGVTVSNGWIDGGNALQMVDGYENIPVNGAMAARIVGWGEFGGGYVNQHAGLNNGYLLQNVNDRNVSGGRLEFLFQPTTNFKLTAAATAQKINVDGIQSVSIGTGLYEGAYNSNETTQKRYFDEYQQFSLSAEYTAPFGAFTAVGSYGKQREQYPGTQTGVLTGLKSYLNFLYCGPGTPPAPGVACPVASRGAGVYATDLNFHDYTGEIRFTSSFSGPLQLVAGAYFEKDVTNDDTGVTWADNTTGFVPCSTEISCSNIGQRQNLVFGAIITDRTDQWAIYGQADYKILPNLTATAGIRYYDAHVTDQSISTQGFVTGYVGIVDPANVPGPVVKGNFTKPSYNFSLLYQVTPSTSLYARAASGFRLGGTNAGSIPAKQVGYDVPDAYTPDTMWSYELGAKTYFLDHKAYTELSIYQMDWKGFPTQGLIGGFGYVVNASAVRIRGAEFTLNYSAGGPISLGGGVTYTDATLQENLSPQVVASGTIGYAGDRVPNVPRLALSGYGEYEVPVGTNMGYFRTDLTYRGSSYNSWDSHDTFNQELPAYFVIAASAGVRFKSAEVGVYVENLTNKYAYAGVTQNSSENEGYLITPRTVGIRLNYKF